MEKGEFMKRFCQTLCPEECSHFRKLLGKRAKSAAGKKRKWVGVPYEEYMQRKKQPAVPPPELRPSAPSDELKPGEGKKGWWKNENIISLDVEKVSMRHLDGLAKMKPAIVGITNTKYEVLLDEKIYRKPGTFLDGKKDVEVSGITRHSLEDGKPWEEVKKKVMEEVKGKMIVTVAGESDLYCLELEESDYSTTFDLQSFYRRSHPERPGADQEMSLRDMYFHHFKEDIHYKKPHSAIEDARHTMKIFLEGYVPLKSGVAGNPEEQKNVEGFDFDDVPRLKRLEKQGLLWCKPQNKFIKNCKCEYCVNWYK